MKGKLSVRIWILIAFVMLSLVSIFSIPPMFLQKGLEITSVDQNSTLFEDGLRKGMTLLEINGQPIETLEDYSSALSFEGIQKTIVQL